MICRVRESVQQHQQLLGLDGLPLLHPDLPDLTGGAGGNGRLHLHSLDGHEYLILLHGVAGLHVELGHHAGDGGPHLTGVALVGLHHLTGLFRSVGITDRHLTAHSVQLELDIDGAVIVVVTQPQILDDQCLAVLDVDLVGLHRTIIAITEVVAIVIISLIPQSALIETILIIKWMVIIIISREFIISGFRLIASDNGVVIAASYWGKFKTTFQMLMVIVLILNIQMSFFQILGVILTYVALILTVVSLIDYIVKNKDVLKEQN